jgi:hypothetical protein
MTIWEYLYKIDYKDQTLTSTNLLYAPKVNSDGRFVLRMDWEDLTYHKKQLKKELKDFFFKREIKYLFKFTKYEWCPAIMNISGPEIFLEFQKETLNNIVMDPTRNLDEECPTWKEQINKIVYDTEREGVYKMTLYPHCFFIHDGVVKTFDFYGCASFEEKLFPIDKIKDIIGQDSVDRFSEATTGDTIDFELFYKRLISHHLNSYWPVNPFSARS